MFFWQSRGVVQIKSISGGIFRIQNFQNPKSRIKLYSVHLIKHASKDIVGRLLLEVGIHFTYTSRHSCTKSSRWRPNPSSAENAQIIYHTKFPLIAEKFSTYCSRCEINNCSTPTTHTCSANFFHSWTHDRPSITTHKLTHWLIFWLPMSVSLQLATFNLISTILYTIAKASVLRWHRPPAYM